MKRDILVLIAGAVVLAACSDEPTAPPSTPRSAAIVHGPRGGNPFFQWAPFLFNPPGEFSADLSPRVEICALGTGGSCPLIANGTFTRTSGRGSRIQVIADGPGTRRNHRIAPRYELIWRTQLFNLTLGQVYRVRVLVGTRELGLVDLKAARNLGEALRFTRQSLIDNDPANDVIGFRVGDAFPLWWGIFKGALCSPLCTPENIVAADIFQGIVPASGGTFYTPSGHAATRIPALPNGQQVNLVIARVAGACLPTHLQTAGGCYLFDTEPKLPPDLAGVLVATCLRPAQTDGHWALFKFNPDRPDLGVRQLDHADEVLIDDCSGFALHRDRGAARYAKAGLRLLVRPLAALFGPTPVSAALENRGFTHMASGMEDGPFSVFDWAKPVRITKTAGDGQIGIANTTLLISPTVQVVTDHGTTMPVSGAPLDFTFRDPAGVSSTVSQVSDANGNAAALWSLGSATGTYSLTVQLGKFSGTRQGVSYDLVESKNRDESDDTGQDLTTPAVMFTAQAATGTRSLVSVSLAPPTANLSFGDTVRFSATGNFNDETSSAVPVTYAATGGTIDTDGLYTAGNTIGSFQVIASHESGKADTSAVTIVCVACSNEVHVQPGSAPPRPPGEVVAHNFTDALAFVRAGGVIRVHEGVYTTRNILIDKPVTIEGVGPTKPIIDAAGDWGSFAVQGVSAGLVRFSGLSFQNASGNTIHAEGQFDSLVVRGAEFVGTGIHVQFTTNPNATVVAENNLFSGGAAGLGLHRTAVRFVIVNNELRGQSRVAIAVDAGTGTIEGNNVTGCGIDACIAVWSAVDADIRNNRMTTDLAARSSTGLSVSAGNAVVQGNQVIGTGFSGPAVADSSQYAFILAGINIRQTGTAQVSQNLVRGAAAGIWFDAATVSGTDNVIDLVAAGFGGWGPALGNNVTMRRNDITNYYSALDGKYGSYSFASADFRCNWWGLGGPVLNVTGAPYSPTSYTPWADTPIANQPSVVCNL